MINAWAVFFSACFQARALTAQTAETDAIRFLVGTQSLKFDNQVSECTHGMVYAVDLS